MRHSKSLKVLLYAGAAYFFCVAFVHAVGLKLPGLFVYYNVPSHAYQDRIISFLTFGWGVFFLLAARKPRPDLIKAILMVGIVAVLALLVNTLITDFSRIDMSIRKAHFIYIILALFVYWSGLVFFSRELIKKNR